MDWWFILAALLAEVVGTLVGFGSAMILLPVALLFYDFHIALVLVSFVHLFGNLARLSFFHTGLKKRLLVRFGLPSILLSLIGAWLVGSISQSLLEGLLGIFLVGYAVVFFKKNWKINASTANMVIGGASSGFVSGLIGTGGALRGAFLAGMGLRQQQYMATVAAVSLMADSTRIPLYVHQGLLPHRYYIYLPTLFFVAITGACIGKILVTKVPPAMFRRLVLIALFVAGLKFLTDYLLH